MYPQDLLDDLSLGIENKFPLLSLLLWDNSS